LSSLTNNDVVTFSVSTLSLNAPSAALAITQDSISILGPVTITGGPDFNDLLFLLGKNILLRSVNFNSINPNLFNLLNIQGNNTVIQNVTSSLVAATQSHIRIGGSVTVDGVLVGNSLLEV